MANVLGAIKDFFAKPGLFERQIPTPSGEVQSVQFQAPPKGLTFLADFLAGIGSLQAAQQQQARRQAIVDRELQRRQEIEEFRWRAQQTKIQQDIQERQIKLQEKIGKLREQEFITGATARGEIVPTTQRRLGTPPIIGQLQRTPEGMEISGQAFRPTTPTERFGIRRQQLETEASAQIQAKISAAQAFAKQFGFKEGSPEFNQSVGRALGVQPLTQLGEVAKSVGLTLPPSLANVLIESDEAVKMLLQFQRMDATEQKAALAQANKLRVDRRQELQKIGWFEVDNSISRVESGARNPTAAGDLVMIFSLMKALDPTSVVREGEFATAQNSAGVPDRTRNVYNKVLTGARLTPGQRQDFLNQARQIHGETKRRKTEIDNFYNRLARDAGISPDLIIRPEPQDIPTQPTPEHKLFRNNDTGEYEWRLPARKLGR